MKAIIADLRQNRIEGVGYITLKVNVSDMANVESLTGLELEATLKRYSKGRSLNANAYYWSLCNQLASRFGVTNAWMHNSLLQRYGTYAEFGGQCAFVSLPEDTDVMENEMVHLKPTGEPGEFILLKGSHEYNQTEMARLIDGLVSECKEQGIETKSKEEIERMLALWKA